MESPTQNVKRHRTSVRTHTSAGALNTNTLIKILSVTSYCHANVNFRFFFPPRNVFLLVSCSSVFWCVTVALNCHVTDGLTQQASGLRSEAQSPVRPRGAVTLTPTEGTVRGAQRVTSQQELPLEMKERVVHTVSGGISGVRGPISSMKAREQDDKTCPHWFGPRCSTSRCCRSSRAGCWSRSK